MTGEIFGHYRLDAFIGCGGMAEVYRATALEGGAVRPGSVVAIKRLLSELAQDSKWVDMFIDEADISRQLHHPAIIEVYETGVVGDVYYIAMDYIEGRDLGQILRQCRQRRIFLPIDFACYVIHVLAEALHYAHEAKSLAGLPLGIVHCDVTPSNVFISKWGDIKLGDFGAARVSALYDLPRGEGIMGKAHYLSPEQILEKPISPATDVFALGVILYELLTNSSPFNGSSVQEIWSCIVDGKVDPPSKRRKEVSPELDALVLRALAPQLPESTANPVSLGERMRDRMKSWIDGGATRTRFDTAQALGAQVQRFYDPHIGTPLALASVVRGLFDLNS